MSPSPYPPGWRVLLVGLAVGLLGLAPRAAGQERDGDLPLGYKHLVAAYTYRTVDPAGGYNDYVVLGHYDFLDGANVQFTYFLYDGRKNARPSPLPLRHPRLLPEASAGPGAFKVPAYAAFEKARGTWLLADGVLRVRFGDLMHEWALRDPAEHFFVPRGPHVNLADDSNASNGLTFTNTQGFAYLTNAVTLPRRLTRDDLLPYYKGEIYTLLLQKGREPKWLTKPSDLHLSRFKDVTPDVLGLSVVSGRTKPPAYVLSALALNQAPHSKLLIYSEGGHDFNRNGVFDEFGHTMQMFGVHDGKRVSKIVYIEYSYQYAGYPMMSVGRYFRPTAARPTETATPARREAPPPTRPAALPASDDDFIEPLPRLQPRN